jgi:hypothetical protein
MRTTFMVTGLLAISFLTACSDGDYAVPPPVGEKQIECYGYEQTFTDDTASVFERAEARSRFFDNDCVLRGGSYG